MDIQKLPTLAEKQTFWAEQLPKFESKYWLPDHLSFLVFDMDQGSYVVKDDLDPIYEEDANEIFHRVNTGWAMWKKAVNFTVNEAKASVAEFEIGRLDDRVTELLDERQDLYAQINTKAQAVPEGFVLVPKNKSEAFSKKLNDYLDDAWKEGNGFDDGFVSVNEINHDKIWSLVVEAQEQK